MSRLVCPSLEKNREFLARAARTAKKIPVTLLVPSATYRDEAQRLMLEMNGNVAGVDIVQLEALALRLANAEPVSEHVLKALCASLLLASDTPELDGMYRGAIRALAQDMLRLFDVLRSSCMENDQLTELVRNSAPDCAGELADLFESYCELLEKKNVLDRAALTSLAASNCRKLPIRGHLFICGFHSFTPVQARLVTELIKGADACASLIETDPAEMPLESGFFETVTKVFGKPEACEGDCSRKLLFSEPEDSTLEGRYAASYAIRRLKEGSRPGQVALIFPEIGEAAEVACDLLEKLEVPVDMPNVTGKRRLPLLNVFANMLAICENGADPSLVPAVFASPCVALSGTGGAMRVDIVRYIVLTARLRRTKGHLANWGDAIADLLTIFEDQKDEKGISSGDMRFTVGELRAASKQVRALLDALRDLCSASAYNMTERVLALTQLDVFENVREQLKARLVKLLEKVTDSVAVSGIPVPLAMRFALDEEFAHSDEPPVSDAVVIATPLTGRNLLREHLFFGGLCEGDFPRTTEFLPLLPSLSRDKRLVTIDRLAESRYLFSLLIGRASDAVLSAPRMDGLKAKSPSFYHYYHQQATSPTFEPSQEETALVSDALLDSRAAFSGEPLSDEWVNSALRYLSAFPGQVRGVPGSLANFMRLMCDVSPYSGALAFTAASGPVRKVVADILGKRIPVSRIESMARCPLRFFFSWILGLERHFDESEALLPARDRGTLLHDLLNRFYIAYSKKFGDEPVCERREEADGVALGVLRELVEQSRAERQPEYIIRWLDSLRRNDRAAGVLARFLDYEAEQQLPVPAVTELPFSEKLPEIGNLHLSGKIDRVDPSPEGPVVVDYKSGSPPPNWQIKEAYSMQLQLYSEYIEKKFGKPVSTQYHYSLARKFGRGTMKQHEEVVALGRENAKAICEALVKQFENCCFNRSYGEKGEHLHCPYSRMCYMLCDERTAPQFELDEVGEKVYSRSSVVGR